jgi:hypothetical protein
MTKFQTIWQKHLENQRELECFNNLKKAGYGSSKKAQLRNLRIYDMYFKEGKSMKEIAVESKLTYQAIHEVIKRIKDNSANLKTK